LTKDNGKIKATTCTFVLARDDGEVLAVKLQMGAVIMRQQTLPDRGYDDDDDDDDDDDGAGQEGIVRGMHIQAQHIERETGN
jgi:hypothetical protein